MINELAILRAMLRLSRRQEPATPDALLVRVGGTEGALDASLAALAAAGFVELRGGAAPRLTLAGLAVAVAQVARVGRAAAQSRARAPKRAAAKRRAA